MRTGFNGELEPKLPAFFHFNDAQESSVELQDEKNADIFLCF